MSEDDSRHPFANFLDKLTEQLNRLDSLTDGAQQGGDTNKANWSIGWKFSMGSGLKRTPGSSSGSKPSSPVRPHKTATKPSTPEPHQVDVQPRALGFFEVHDEGDHLLVIAELPGLEEDDLRAELTHDDVLTISISSDGHVDQRDILLPATGRAVKVEHRHGIWTIHCDLQPREKT